MTYDLGRLRRKRLIERLPHSQRYTLKPDGRRLAVLLRQDLHQDRLPITRRA